MCKSTKVNLKEKMVIEEKYLDHNISLFFISMLMLFHSETSVRASELKYWCASNHPFEINF